ncbi:MAG: hypothetical protein CMF48_07030 [Legionellales bacterium]|nr:hypothetical protein [Legionellales bacterium]
MKCKTQLCTMVVLTTLLANSGLAFASPPPVTEDNIIAAEVCNNLIHEHHMPYKDLHISTCDDVVCISGEIKTELEMQEIIDIAQNSDKRIKFIDAHDLHVEKSHNHVKDLITERRIKNRILQAKAAGQVDVHDDILLECKNGYVHVAGHVATADDMARVIDIISEQKGIKEIDNHMHV